MCDISELLCRRDATVSAQIAWTPNSLEPSGKQPSHRGPYGRVIMLAQEIA